MGRKMKLLPSLFKNRESMDRPWQWPICGSSKTPSFRAGDGEIFTTVNSMFLENFLSDQIQTPDSWFANSWLFDSARFSTDFEDDLEVVIRGAKSERLIFEPGETNSILEKSRIEEAGSKCEPIGLEGSVVLLAMESEDPYLDFRRSMEEMVESHGIRDWEWLEALLNWYLRMNRIKNHGYILGAFVDLLVDLGGGGGDGSMDSTSIFSDELIVQHHDRERCVV
ncbi:transcription repressor OFP13-like [Benincasa hispida]|uniref:transcription repressor OFP13-like n=1 Tax=Benincasa hispida TaxID=102211 RepID=UPI0019008688|nr:transcription repressor OFP13-like [Benincasa hispida]